LREPVNRERGIKFAKASEKDARGMRASVRLCTKGKSSLRLGEGGWKNGRGRKGGMEESGRKHLLTNRKRVTETHTAHQRERERERERERVNGGSQGWRRRWR
jgi:hypothetical protein